MSKVEGLDAAGITAWINGLDRPPLVSKVDSSKESESKIEAIPESSEDSSDLSNSGHAFARASERLRDVGYRHRGEGEDKARDSETNDSEPDASSESEASDGNELTPSEKEEVRKLQESDTRVRAHEMAHKAAAGSLAAGGPYYDLQQGPDGQNYAVGGEVPIRLPRTDDYKQALKDAQQAERAALAPADPSPDDYAAAAAFRQRAVEARSKLSKEAQEEVSDQASQGTSVKGAEKKSEDETAPSSGDTPPASVVEQPVPSSFSTSAKADLDSPS